MTGSGKPTSESTFPSEYAPKWRKSCRLQRTSIPFASSPLKKTVSLTIAISLPISLHDNVGAIHWVLSERLSVV